MSESLAFSQGFALLVGVGKTPSAPGWSLPVAARDAQALALLLKEPKVCAYPDDHVRVLLNEQASRHNILGELGWLKEKAKQERDSTVIIFYSGHGLRHDDGRYALVPSDLQLDHPEGSLLWADDFTAAIHAIRPRRLLVLLDTCFAAGMATAKGDGTDTLLGFTKTPPPEDIHRRLLMGEGRAVISSSREGQQSYYPRGGQLSFFTEVLLEALRGAASLPREKTVRVTSVIGHVGWKVPKRVQQEIGYHAEQEPWTEYVGQDFPVALLAGGKGLSEAEASSTSPTPRTTVNVVAVQDLLKETFPDAGLRLIGQVLSGDLSAQLADWMRQESLIYHIIEYCLRHDSFERLLDYVREKNPTKFAQYRSRLYS